MFGGFCLLFFVFCHALVPPCWGVTFFASLILVLGQIFLIRILPVAFWLPFVKGGCFCLESLILAQDERWRRA